MSGERESITSVGQLTDKDAETVARAANGFGMDIFRVMSGVMGWTVDISDHGKFGEEFCVRIARLLREGKNS